MKKDEGLGTIFFMPIKVLAICFVFGIAFVFPTVLFVSFLPRIIPGNIQVKFGNTLSILLSLAWFVFFCMFGIKYIKACKRWLTLGHFHEEYNDEYFKRIRRKWLKNNNGPRTKTKQWTINLSKLLNERTLSKSYPIQNGSTNLFADPINYQTEVDISLFFHGNTPIIGDKIKISFSVSSNIDMKALHIALADTSSSEKIGYKKPTESTVCATNIKQNVPFNVEKEILVEENIQTTCAILLWNELEEVAQEAFLSHNRR